jgi:hypothetical protein
MPLILSSSARSMDAAVARGHGAALLAARDADVGMFAAVTRCGAA